MDDQQCILLKPCGIFVCNVYGFSAGKMETKGDEWPFLQFLSHIFAGHNEEDFMWSAPVGADSPIDAAALHIKFVELNRLLRSREGYGN